MVGQFLAALVADALATGYTLTVARHKLALAVICSGALEYVNARLVRNYVIDEGLINVMAVAAMVGTALAILISERLDEKNSSVADRSPAAQCRACHRGADARPDTYTGA